MKPCAIVGATFEVPHDQGSLGHRHQGTWWMGDGAKDEEVIVQIMGIGIGPVKTTQIEVDEKGNPVRR